MPRAASPGRLDENGALPRARSTVSVCRPPLASGRVRLPPMTKSWTAFPRLTTRTVTRPVGTVSRESRIAKSDSVTFSDEAAVAGATLFAMEHGLLVE